MKTFFRALILCAFATSPLTHAADGNATLPALIGKWRLVEYYFDIGDGKGHLNWQKAAGETAQTMELKADGTFIYTTAVPNPQGHKQGKYVIEKKAGSKNPVIKFTWAEPAVAGETTTWSSTIVALKADQLELSGPGIEGSGMRYQRVK